jgi:hypothetical protein
MSKKYTLGPDVPADEPVYDSKGNLVDDGYIDQAVEDVHRALGRPSLSGAGSSPRVSFRLSAETRQAAEKIAEQQGVSLSELARHALEELVHKRAG